MAWYDFLTWLQETLAHALMDDGDGEDLLTSDGTDDV